MYPPLTMTTLLESGRTHTCGELRRGDVGAQVVLFGWVHRRRDLGKRIFVQLRDRDGITQISFAEEIDAAAYAAAESLRSEDCIAVRGSVVDRGDNANDQMATGAIEVAGAGLEVFSKAETPPFVIAEDDRLDAQENLRLKYRYLDLRRPSLQQNFKRRARIGYVTRKVLSDLGFYELETPFMVKYTPGGARNFLVPSRLHPGQFYALAESPQIYKQLFMVSGMDKYFQITRCFRDEDLRFDRQPEFTQIDVEMSFATPARVFEAMEKLMSELWSDVLGVEVPTPFVHLTWEEAMERYGNDKPDTRFGLELTNITDLTRNCGFGVFEGAECVSGLCVPPEYSGTLSRGKMDKLTDFVKKRENGGAKGLAWARIEDDGSWKAGFAKNLSDEAKTAIADKLGAKPGSVLMFIADEWHKTHTVLSTLRLHLRDELNLLEGSEGAWNFLWVTEFPLFEQNESGQWVSSHHPFTMPRPEHVELLLTDPGKVRAQAYDLVLNGNEIGGGSIRIHRSDVQAKVFEALGLSDEEADAKFGFLLQAFKYGPPPHGGIALGLDRLAMLMCGATSLRDVIAFPKTQRGQDLMTGCPTPADDPQLAELYITHRPLPQKGDDAQND
jgi:aspartyl-tRNA synthetase